MTVPTEFNITDEEAQALETFNDADKDGIKKLRSNHKTLRKVVSEKDMEIARLQQENLLYQAGIPGLQENETRRQALVSVLSTQENVDVNRVREIATELGWMNNPNPNGNPNVPAQQPGQPGQPGQPQSQQPNQPQQVPYQQSYQPDQSQNPLAASPNLPFAQPPAFQPPNQPPNALAALQGDQPYTDPAAVFAQQQAQAQAQNAANQIGAMEQSFPGQVPEQSAASFQAKLRELGAKGDNAGVEALIKQEGPRYGMGLRYD